MIKSVLMKKLNGTRIMPECYRLHFKNNSDHYTYEDRVIFTKWSKGKITTEKACEMLSANLGTVVTPNIFVANAEWLGYFKEEKK